MKNPHDQSRDSEIPVIAGEQNRRNARHCGNRRIVLDEAQRQHRREPDCCSGKKECEEEQRGRQAAQLRGARARHQKRRTEIDAGKKAQGCRAGAIMLRDSLGIPKEKVFVYGGGFTEWTNNGMPFELGQRNSGELTNVVKTAVSGKVEGAKP